jgi:hypothetical protein
MKTASLATIYWARKSNIRQITQHITKPPPNQTKARAIVKHHSHIRSITTNPFTTIHITSQQTHNSATINIIGYIKPIRATETQKNISSGA